MHADEIRINQKRPFKQGNTAQNERMRAWLREKLTHNSHLGKVVELFCGSGNFTEIIAESDCASIIAYESERHAIQALEVRNLTKVTTQIADLFKLSVWSDIRKNVFDAEILLLDPPQSGLKKHHGFFARFAT